MKTIRWASIATLLCALSLVGALAGCTKDSTEVIAEPGPTGADTPTTAPVSPPATAAPDTPPATSEPSVAEPTP